MEGQQHSVWSAWLARSKSSKKYWSLMPLAFVLSLPVKADNCPAVQCDCGSILNTQWQADCFAEEQALKAACVENQGKPTAYCALHGADARPVAISLKNKPVKALEVAKAKEIEKDIDRIRWSMSEDIDISKQLIEQAEWRNALLMRKNIEKNRRKIFKIQAVIAASYTAADDEDEAFDYWQAAAKAHVKEARLLEREADNLWQQTLDVNLDAESRKGIMTLASRILRNAGASYERAAQAYSNAGDYNDSATAWQASAFASEKLSAWWVALDAESKFVAYYRKQAAARWYRSAYVWLLEQQQPKADVTRSQAERILAGGELMLPLQEPVEVEDQADEEEGEEVKSTVLQRMNPF